MPHPLELPRVLRTVVPLMRCQRLARLVRSVIDELVALPLWHAVRRREFLRLAARRNPRLAPIIRSLHHLPEPAAALRRKNPVGVLRRALHVIDFPPHKQRPANRPLLSRAIGAQDETALFRADKNAYAAHG